MICSTEVDVKHVKSVKVKLTGGKNMVVYSLIAWYEETGPVYE